MSNTLSPSNVRSWKTYSDKIEKRSREKAQSSSMQDEVYKRMISQQNYLQPQHSLSSSIYGSHTYEPTQFSTPQICDACDHWRIQDFSSLGKDPSKSIF